MHSYFKIIKNAHSVGYMYATNEKANQKKIKIDQLFN